MMENEWNNLPPCGSLVLVKEDFFDCGYGCAVFKDGCFYSQENDVRLNPYYWRLIYDEDGNEIICQ